MKNQASIWTEKLSLDFCSS